MNNLENRRKQQIGMQSNATATTSEKIHENRSPKQLIKTTRHINNDRDARHTAR